jgi:chromate reductase
MRILGITGSLRKDSHNSLLLRSASRVIPVDAELVELDVEVLRNLPHYDEDLDTPDQDNAWVLKLRDEVKNAVDWVSRPPQTAVIKGKPAAAISASTGQFGGVWAQDHLRKVLSIAGARVIDAEFAIAKAHEVHAEHGDVLHQDAEAELAEILEALVEEGRINASLAAAA